MAAKTIHQMWTPEREAYTERREVAFGAQLETATIEGLTIEMAGF